MDTTISAKKVPIPETFLAAIEKHHLPSYNTHDTDIWEWKLVSDASQILAAETAGNDVIYTSNAEDLYEILKIKYQNEESFELIRLGNSVLGNYTSLSNSEDLTHLKNLVMSSHPMVIRNRKYEPGYAHITITKNAAKKLTKDHKFLNRYGQYPLDNECFLQSYLDFPTPVECFREILKKTSWEELVAKSPNYLKSKDIIEGQTLLRSLQKMSRKYFLVHHPSSAAAVLLAHQESLKIAKKNHRSANTPKIKDLYKLLSKHLVNHLLSADKGQGSFTHPHWNRYTLKDKQILAATCRLYQTLRLLKLDLLADSNYLKLLQEFEKYIPKLQQFKGPKKELGNYLAEDLKQYYQKKGTS